jgi:hypothetical protein
LAVTNVGLATPRSSTLVDQERIVFTVAEANQGAGGTDLNGDGDVDDLILHVFRVPTGLTTNLGLAVSATPPFVVVDDHDVVFTVAEASQGAGGTDLNGDGDVDDLVLHVFRVRTGLTTNVQLAVSGDLAAGKDWARLHCR